MALFEYQMTLPCGVQTLFDFLSRPENVARISPPTAGLTFVAAPDVVEQGSRLEFKIQGFGQIQQIVHEIVAFEPPRRIVERQVKGPMKRWEHDHLFEATDGETTVIDRIEFDPPGGLIGLLVTESKILDALDDTYYYREQELRRLVSRGVVG